MELRVGVQHNAAWSMRGVGDQLAEHLGHSDPGFTQRTYTHLTPSSKDRTRHDLGQEPQVKRSSTLYYQF
ncbi:hypothetical protein ABJI51_42045 [Amycolatopsis sp. NEAU-NG30]|uniref:Integrase n=1 Tax=Amycolatopsis melonis TaxID=3156488 RepID=A0ABV0LTS1_9PSEU